MTDPNTTPQTKERLVVIGNGMAPGKTLETLLEVAPGKFDITIFNAEPRVNYNRIMLSPVLSGETCLLYTSPSPRDISTSRMPSSA